MPKLVYIGTPDDVQTQLISEGGLDFVKGQPVEVKDKAVFDRLKVNPTFAEHPDDEDVSETDEDVEALKAELDKRQIKYRANASADNLRKLLADKLD